MAPGIDAFPGARRQPRGEPPARAETELKGLVDEMGSPVMEDRTGRRQRCPASLVAVHTGKPSFR